MRRISTGKRVELTTRDIELFKLLYRYHYLRSTFLYAFLGGSSETRFKERLGHLYHDGGYINRPVQQWQFANCRYMPVIYELDTKGEHVLREQGLMDDRGPLLKKGRMGAYRQFSHQLMICDCMASIELGVRERPDLRFISWQEIMAKAPARETANPFEMPASISHTLPRSQNTHRADITIVPDGLFGLEYTHDATTSYRFFALEADRSTMPVTRGNLHQSSYLEKDAGVSGDHGAARLPNTPRRSQLPHFECHHDRATHASAHGASQRTYRGQGEQSISVQDALDARRFPRRSSPDVTHTDRGVEAGGER
jgi:Replication-relaxation